MFWGYRSNVCIADSVTDSEIDSEVDSETDNEIVVSETTFVLPCTCM